MNDFNEAVKTLENITIKGLNLGEETGVSFRLLTDYYSSDDERTQKALEELQKHYIDTFMINSKVNPMCIKNGKIEIRDGQLYHHLSRNVGIEQLISISRIGLVASEWFGISESEGEAFFCTFLDEEKKGQKRVGRGHFSPEGTSDFSRKALSQCTLYFDESNPIIQRLLSLDYFEYQRMRKNCPERIRENYPEWLIEFYQNVNDPECSFSSSFHDKEDNPRYTWRAIPGGIPPQFINGICICSISELNEHIEEIKELFPNATIFNEDKEVIYAPRLEHTAKEIGDAIGDILPKDVVEAQGVIVDAKEKDKIGVKNR